MDETHTDSETDDRVQLSNKLQGLVANLKWGKKDIIELFNALLKRFNSASQTNNLLQWMMEMLHCIEIYYITPSWRSGKDQKDKKTVTELVRDKNLTDDDIKNLLADDTEKTLQDILEEMRQDTLNQVDEELLEKVKDIVSSVQEALETKDSGSRLSGLKNDLLRLCRAAEQTKYKPRLTQMVGWCLMALSHTSRLIQVGTGEGKSCIVAMFAAFQALRGKKVDVMSSSSVLAERDCDDWKEFYAKLKISVNCNTNTSTEDKKKCYECQVIYGTVKEFAGDWLRQHFQRMDIFGQRKFECAIVDEVDSLMLDRGHHVVYLSSDMPALHHLNPLLALIWATVSQYKKISTETTVGRKVSFPQAVLDNTSLDKGVDEFSLLQMGEDMGLLKKGSVKELKRNPDLYDQKMSRVTARQLAGFFKAAESKYPSCRFSLHCMNDDGSTEQLNKRPEEENTENVRVPLLLTDGGFCQYMYSDKASVVRAAEEEIKRATRFTPCEPSRDKKTVHVPGFLSELVECKRKLWIQNAFYAQTLTNDHQYVLDGDRVVPVDYSCTGVVQNFTKWSDGLHQFLEMKHKTKLSDMTPVTNYMSNVGLLRKYGKQIFGVTGTLGQKTEIETLQKIYDGMESCQIPSFKRRKLFEVEGLIINNELEWTDTICQVIKTQTSTSLCRRPRAVLVICDTISRAKALHQALKLPKEKLYINNNMDNSAIFAKKLDAGEVLIATNLAGRGTDLQVSPEVNSAGGLFVLQTFLPKNARVEAQAFGRTARQGSPGSAQLIVCSNHLERKPVQLLSLPKQLSSPLENMTQLIPAKLSSYQKGFSVEDARALSLTLLHILQENSESATEAVKEVRDRLVAEELRRYLETTISRIKKKEALLLQYMETLDGLYKSTNNKPAKADVSALNEFWGLWLLTSFNADDSLDDLRSRLDAALKGAVEKLRARESPSSNLHHYTTLGNELQQEGQRDKSMEMYTKAIEQDPCWAAMAYYNRACTSLAQQRGNQDLDCIIQHLHNAHRSVELYIKQTNTVRYYVRQQPEDPASDSSRFDKHIDSRLQVLDSFQTHITMAIKKVEEARDHGGNVKVDKVSVDSLVPLVHHIPFLTLLVNNVQAIRSHNPLQTLQLVTDPGLDRFFHCRFLESLGLTHVYIFNTSKCSIQ